MSDGWRRILAAAVPTVRLPLEPASRALGIVGGLAVLEPLKAASRDHPDLARIVAAAVESIESRGED